MSAGNEAPQGAGEIGQPVKEPVGQGRKPKGREAEAHDQQGDPIEHIPLDGQHQRPDPAQHKCQNGQDSGGEGQQERQDGHGERESQRKGGGDQFQYDPHLRYLLFPVYVYCTSAEKQAQGKDASALELVPGKRYDNFRIIQALGGGRRNMNIAVELKRFLSQKANNGALLITGKWGCGKTYLLRAIANEYNMKKEFLIVTVSLFGVDTIDSLHQAVKEKIAFARGFSDKADTAQKWMKGIKKASTPVTSALSEFSQIAKGFNAVLNINWSDFVSVEKNIDCFVDGQKISKILVLIFDDFERSKINRVDLMGAINDYSESKDIKVIIVANEDEIKDNSYNDIKEKLISRTIHMSLNIEHIVGNLISSYEESAKNYKMFLQTHSSIIHKIFVDSQSENIRSLKSILIDFERVYAAWKSTDVPMDGNSEHILYQFGAVEFEYKAGNFVNSTVCYTLHVDGDTDKSDKKKAIENKYISDTFKGLLTSLSMWIVDGEWDETFFVEEIRKRYLKEAFPPEQRFTNWRFWDLQQDDIDIGMPIILQKAYNGEASRDELIALLQKTHAMKKYDISLPCDVDYTMIEAGFEKRKNGIRAGKISEPKRHTFSEKSQLDSEAYEVYDKIELMDDQLYAWKNRDFFIAYLNDEDKISYYDLKGRYLESFDDELFKLFFKKYIAATNSKKREMCQALDDIYFDNQQYSKKCDLEVTAKNLKLLIENIKSTILTDTDKMSNAISTLFIELLINKVEQILKSI